MTRKLTLAVGASIAVLGFGFGRSASAQSYYDRGGGGFQISIGTGGFYGDQGYYGSQGYYGGYDDPRASWLAPEQWDRHERAEATSRSWGSLAAFGRGRTVRAAIDAHEVTTGLLYTWRRLFLAGKLGMGAVTVLPSFARVEVADMLSPVALPMAGEVAAPAATQPCAGVIAIELPSGVRVRLEGAVDADTLARTLAALG